MAGIVVRGLREAARNLAQIGKVGSTELARATSFDAAQVVARAIRAATYSTFTKRTGLIRKGFAVRVKRDLEGGVLNTYVVQADQPMFGPNSVRALARPGKKRRKAVPIYTRAFYWRFLEFGTQGRRNVRTPKAPNSKGKAAARYAAGKSLKDIVPRSWVRPAFSGSAAGAVAEYSKSFRTRIETAINNLSKK